MTKAGKKEKIAQFSTGFFKLDQTQKKTPFGFTCLSQTFLFKSIYYFRT